MSIYFIFILAQVLVLDYKVLPNNRTEAGSKFQQKVNVSRCFVKLAEPGSLNLILNKKSEQE